MVGTWSYSLGRYDNKLRLAEIVFMEDKKMIWGYPVSWWTLFRHPIMVLTDLYQQSKHKWPIFNLNTLVKEGNRYLTNAK